MKTLRNYITREVLLAVGLVLFAFIAIFTFFDFINELPSIGKGKYQLYHAVLYVLLGMPGYVYELMPIAALIGTIYALSQLAARSEYTVLRVSGMSFADCARVLLRIGLILVALTFLFGELLSPYTTSLGEKLRLTALGKNLAQEFRSGLWVKDTAGEINGKKTIRFINVGKVNPDTSLQAMRVFEFDENLRLLKIQTAERGEYLPPASWQLHNIVSTWFKTLNKKGNTKNLDLAPHLRVETQAEMVWKSELSPDILSVLLVTPDRMALLNLGLYIRHLAQNQQNTDRYEIAFWKKLAYPFAVLVMLALAMPFAYMQQRNGGVSLKIFAGIMIGVLFWLLNSLFSHIGLLNTWPPIFTALAPSVLFMLIAAAWCYWVERH